MYCFEDCHNNFGRIETHNLIRAPRVHVGLEHVRTLMQLGFVVFFETNVFDLSL